MPKFTTPNPLYTGLIGPVQVVNGQGETDDPAVLQYLRSAGILVDGDTVEVENEDGTKTETVVEVKGVEDMSVKDLKVLAQQKGVTVPPTAKKADLVDLIAAKDAADPQSQPAENPSETVSGIVPGTGPETGAAEGAVFGATPATSDSNNENAAGQPV